MGKNLKKNLFSPRTKTAIVIILLILTLLSPLIGLIGVILMWVWMKWSKWVKILVTIPFSLVGLIVISGGFLYSYIFLIRPFQVRGHVMEPAYSNGSYLITNVVNSNSTFVRGTVIIFKSPSNPQINLIERIIALPGDEIMIKGGIVYVNGQMLDESKYLSGIKTQGGSFIKEGEALSVPSLSYFVMGDNRMNISDSRDFGVLHRANIISKVVFCYWSCK